ncbi:hypothetical protein ACTFIY_000828 [Dictyostelium cf. discoideum]
MLQEVNRDQIPNKGNKKWPFISLEPIYSNDVFNGLDEQLHFLDEKYPGLGFFDYYRNKRFNGTTYIRNFHLNERIANFTLCDPAIPQPIFELITKTFIEKFRKYHTPETNFKQIARGLNIADVIEINNQTKIPNEISERYRSYKTNRPLTSLSKYNEKYLQIIYRLMNLGSGYDRSDDFAIKCHHYKTIKNPPVNSDRQFDGKPPSRSHYCKCSQCSPLPLFVTANPKSKEIKEIRWRLKEVGEVFKYYINDQNIENNRRNIINLNYVMCKVLEIMELPTLTKFWPMLISTERVEKIDEHWKVLIDLLRKRELINCRVCNENDRNHHIFLWKFKETLLLHEVLSPGDNGLNLKVCFYHPNTRSTIGNSFKEFEIFRYTPYEYTNLYHQFKDLPRFDIKRGSLPTDSVCPGWWLIQEEKTKKKEMKKLKKKIFKKSIENLSTNAIDNDNDDEEDNDETIDLIFNKKILYQF